jgi:ABC-2 type transport system ATP-binding protein
MRQRLGLAQALVHEPDLLVLDEPTAGVDLEGTTQIEALIAEQKRRGTTVLLTSHTVAQIEALCDRVAVLERGRIVLDTSIDELKGSAGTRLRWKSPSQAATADLTRWLAAQGLPSLERDSGRGALEELLRGKMQRNG